MTNRGATRTLVAVLAACLSGCSDGDQRRSPLGPTAPEPFQIYNVTPAVGYVEGSSSVAVSGSGFKPGTTISFGGIAVEASVVGSSRINALTPAHPEGTVDVVVTLPGGDSLTLAHGYTYQRFGVLAISPVVGATGGGTHVVIGGTGFLAGTTVQFDTASVPSFAYQGNLYLTAPPHDAGIVDVTVVGPDGRTARLASSYTYTTPLLFDVNGTWEGGAGGEQENPLELTIRNNVITAVTCAGASATLSTPVRLQEGEFSYSDDGVVISGRALAPTQLEGAITLGRCGNMRWYAERKAGR
jgi:hypothetical protein